MPHLPLQDPPALPWAAVLAAREHAAAARLPFCVAHAGQALRAGSVARAHLPALAAWPEALHIDARAVTLTTPADARSSTLARINRQLLRDGLLRAWRDETYPLLPTSGDGPLLATLERAAARFWGTLTLGAHCNGYIADAQGRPSHLWIARRALGKAVDPGLLDNLIGGGVPWGQTPAAALLREGWEEAGLRPAQMQGLRPGRRLTVLRDVPEGLQHEQVHSYDLALPAGLLPVNQDGEVHSFTLMPVAQALAQAAAGHMTVDATLVTLDFALRHRLLPADHHQHLRALSDGLWCGTARLDH